ncbi:hypothetical protein GSY74_04920, partial [Sulfurovum sp. bin170]|uniref:hypothetical protein n=1 Tax=Sulfurovum sp. bin170 TaxID=2695268 RepID=UPI0013E05E69
TACGDVEIEDEGADRTTADSSMEATPTDDDASASGDSSLESVEPIDNESDSSSDSLRIIGKITYDRVGVNSNGVGLNYNNITKEAAKQVTVKVIDSTGKTIATTTTDDSGEYILDNLPENTEVKIRVYAEMKKAGATGWDVKVVDNTSGDAQYVIESSLVSTGNSSTRRNMNASSGWGGRSYSGTRNAAPFAILGSIYQAMEKVISADSAATFPALIVNWSVNNVLGGNGSASALRDGQIMTSHFNGENGLYILGDANSDTDEYDDHIIIHEWGHYFEAKFSRADSIGGSHTAGDRLDIRLAFGEGWGNAWSAIATDDTIYYDTLGARQSDGWSMDIESQARSVPGWYSEASIQRILYDLYDSNDDGVDTLSLGFKPIYDVLVGSQKTTPAFTSIFSFIKGLKDENPTSINAIDNILSNENISSIDNIYGSNHYDLYSDLSIGDSTEVCTSIEYGVGSQGHHNILGNHKYVRFTIYSGGTYTIKMSQNSWGSSDPDFALYQVDSFKKIEESRGEVRNVEEARYSLSSGDYMLDIVAWNPSQTRPCFDITVNN